MAWEELEMEVECDTKINEMKLRGIQIPWQQGTQVSIVITTNMTKRISGGALQVSEKFTNNGAFRVSEKFTNM